MDEIVVSVKRVTDIIGEITAASQEQSAGIEQVNQAIDADGQGDAAERRAGRGGQRPPPAPWTGEHVQRWPSPSRRRAFAAARLAPVNALAPGRDVLQ